MLSTKDQDQALEWTVQSRIRTTEAGEEESCGPACVGVSRSLYLQGESRGLGTVFNTRMRHDNKAYQDSIRRHEATVVRL